jgi:hypothetical protein
MIKILLANRRIQQGALCVSLLLTLACFTKAAAQTVTDAFECSRQLARLRAVFNDTVYCSFTATAYIRYNNGQKDTTRYRYQSGNHRLHLVTDDSTETVQNEYYNLSLNHRYKTAMLTQASDPFKYVLQVDVLNYDFYKTFVTGRLVSDTGSYKKLSHQFKAASPYKQYEIVYDPVTFRIRSIQYCYGNGTSATPNSRTPFYVTVLFDNYQTGGFTDAVFSTDPYFLRKNGVFNMVAPYANYTLTNSINQ